MRRAAGSAPTPAVAAARSASVEHVLLEYDLEGPISGVAAARALGLTDAEVFKTLVVRLDPWGFAVMVIPVAEQLDLKRAARAAGAKKAELAPVADAERITGYVVGGVSPLGQRRRLPTYLDESARELPLMYESAGRRGLELGIAPRDLVMLCDASFAPLRVVRPQA